MNSEGKFKRILNADFGVYADFFTHVYCDLYYELKGNLKSCKYPQKTKCERCPVYNGFNGNERYKPILQKLLSGE